MIKRLLKMPNFHCRTATLIPGRLASRTLRSMFGQRPELLSGETPTSTAGPARATCRTSGRPSKQDWPRQGTKCLRWVVSISYQTNLLKILNQPLNKSVNHLQKKSKFRSLQNRHQLNRQCTIPVPIRLVSLCTLKSLLSTTGSKICYVLGNELMEGYPAGIGHEFIFEFHCRVWCVRSSRHTNHTSWVGGGDWSRIASVTFASTMITFTS